MSNKSPSIKRVPRRRTQFHTTNKYLKLNHLEFDISDQIAINELNDVDSKTKYIEVTAKTMINQVKSPDLFMEYSLNPYQSCEHGCIYCYARPTHNYWGYSPADDF